jgi:uncharacterized protein YaaR (DUF327 family)
MTKWVEELEREFAREVRRFIDMAIAEGYSLQEAKAMARDVVARAVRQSFKVVSTDDWRDRSQAGAARPPVLAKA